MDNLFLTMFNISENDIEQIRTINSDNSVFIDIKLIRKDIYCPLCGFIMASNGFRIKPVNHQFLSGRITTINYHARKYRCSHCGHSEYEKNPFSMKGFSTSILTMDNIMRDLRNPHNNYTMLSQRYNVSVTMIERYLDSFVVIPKIDLPVNLGIDEIHSEMAKRRDAKYLGVIIDNDSYNMVDILPSRNKHDLINFFTMYSKEERDKVRYVTIDMWLPYKEVASKYLDNAVIAADPFHVIEHLTADFSKVRIRIMNSMIYKSQGYYLLKNWHKLLDSDKFFLDGEPQYNRVFRKKVNYRDLKRMVLDLSDELNTAHSLKEMYRKFNSECTYEAAGEELEKIISSFANCGIKEYEEFTSILINWKQEIINSFIHSDATDRRLSNARTEAMNNGLKTYIDISNGLANFKRFRKRMIYCFNDKAYYAITDRISSLCRKFKKKKVK